MLNLEFDEDRTLLRDTFARFFEEESSIARVRAAEPLGYDAQLQKSLGELGAFGIRVPESAGGSGMGLIDAALVVEEAGRRLAATPLVEGIVATRLLAELGNEQTAHWLTASLEGEQVVTLALHEARDGVSQIVPGGAVASAVLGLAGDEVFLVSVEPVFQARPNHGSQPIAEMVLLGNGSPGERIVLAKGSEAREAYLAAVEEWKLLTAAQLNGMARRALEYAVDYAKERIQFGRPIGSYQAVAHPLADRATDVDAAQLFTWWSIHQVAKGAADASASIAMSYWWSCKVADETTRRAIHTFGGYGVTLEYDLQLYFRQAKAVPLVLGDPLGQLIEGGRRICLGKDAPLPEAGDPGLDFDFDEEAKALANEARELFERITTPEWREQAHFSYAGYDPEVNRKIGEAGLVHPMWPKEWGGRDAHPYAAALSLGAWEEFNISGHAQSVSHFVGSMLLQFGSDELRKEILLDMGRGITNASLGYSEPHSGSDIFAAKTRAVWDEAAGEWVINGQKMFTSGAEVTDYIFLLTRTDPEGGKHGGITMFMVPMKTKGVEVHPIHTVGEEQTNATFYTDVRLPDRFRVGEVNGGGKVLAEALKLEHGVAYRPTDHGIVDAAIEWAKQPDASGRPRTDSPVVLARLARVKANNFMKELMGKRAMYFGVKDPDQRTPYGSMNKLFGSEAFQRDMNDLIELTAPDSLFHARAGLGKIELGHRHAQVGTIYAGTSEVHRSVVAEVGLGLPRSR